MTDDDDDDVADELDELVDEVLVEDDELVADELELDTLSVELLDVDWVDDELDCDDELLVDELLELVDELLLLLELDELDDELSGGSSLTMMAKCNPYTVFSSSVTGKYMSCSVEPSQSSRSARLKYVPVSGNRTVATVIFGTVSSVIDVSECSAKIMSSSPRVPVIVMLCV